MFRPQAGRTLGAGERECDDHRDAGDSGGVWALGVEEVLIADPAARTLQLLRHGEGDFAPTDRSQVLDVSVADLDAAIDWPDEL